MESVIQKFGTLIANIEDFQNKNRKKVNTNNICVPEHSLENKLPNWITLISDYEVWKKGTVLIVRDSVVSGFQKKYKTPLFSWSKNTRSVLLLGTIAT